MSLTVASSGINLRKPRDSDLIEVQLQNGDSLSLVVRRRTPDSSWRLVLANPLPPNLVERACHLALATLRLHRDYFYRHTFFVHREVEEFAFDIIGEVCVANGYGQIHVPPGTWLGGKVNLNPAYNYPERTDLTWRAISPVAGMVEPGAPRRGPMEYWRRT